MTHIKLGLIGRNGRMGQALVDYLQIVSDVILHCALEAEESLEQFISAKPDVALDLSLGHAVDRHGPLIAAAGIPYIVGATGYDPQTVHVLRERTAHSGSPVLIVPNFSISANLLIRFAASASKLMHSPVITERHHAGKADAPSGTASFTAFRMHEARSTQTEHCDEWPSTTARFTEQLKGVLGATENGIAIHSLRGEGYLAEQEVRLCLPGESLVLEHRSIDRRCFMPGIIYAIRNMERVHGLVIGLDEILEL